MKSPSSPRSAPGDDGRDIKALAPLIGSVMEDNNLCVMGSEATIRQEKDLFTNLVSLPD